MVAEGALGPDPRRAGRISAGLADHAARGNRPEAGGLAHRSGAQRARRCRSATSAPMPSIWLSSSPACAPSEVAADLATFVPGRRLDDNAQLLLRFDGGVRAACCGRARSRRATRTRCGCGSTAKRPGWSGSRKQPNAAAFLPGSASRRSASRGRGPGARAPAAAHASRVPAGHPEGYLEALRPALPDFAEQITARTDGRDPIPPACWCPQCGTGSGVFVSWPLPSNPAAAAAPGYGCRRVTMRHDVRKLKAYPVLPATVRRHS